MAGPAGCVEAMTACTASRSKNRCGLGLPLNGSQREGATRISVCIPMVPSYALRRTQMRALPYTISLMSSCTTPATAAFGLLPLRLRWRSQCCAAAPNANPNPETHMVTPTPGPRAPDSNSTRKAGIEHRAHPEPNTHPIPAPSLTNLVHARTRLLPVTSHADAIPTNLTRPGDPSPTENPTKPPSPIFTSHTQIHPA
jgi:hypothetical protein